MGKSKSLGVVIVKVEGENQAYIGTSKHNNSITFDEELDDAVWVAKRGARFPLEVVWPSCLLGL